MSTKAFHIGDIISVVADKMVSPGFTDGVAALLGWMTGEPFVMTHQLPRLSRECENSLHAQHPDLAAVIVPKGLDSRDKVMTWLATLYPAYGETREITPLHEDDHTHISPFAEMRLRNPRAEIVPFVIP
jgi:hypothetical protein